MKINDRQFIELYGGSDEAHPGGLMHVCYEVKNIESLVQAYTVRGVNPPTSRKARAGNTLMMLHDPERQVVEFTQYLPGSLHFEDQGKHLREHRISHQLIEVGMDVHDLAVEKVFYTYRHGFEETGATGLSVKLRLPGDSGEQIELESSKPESKPRIVFETASVARASEELRLAGLDSNRSAVSVAVPDPHGTVILFVQTHDPPREGNK